MSMRSGRAEESLGSKGWDAAKGVGAGLKLQERPMGKDGRVVPEVRIVPRGLHKGGPIISCDLMDYHIAHSFTLQVVGVKEVKCETAEDLTKFYSECMENRSTTSTKLNDR